jgi:hypothetical protein
VLAVHQYPFRSQSPSHQQRVFRAKCLSDVGSFHKVAQLLSASLTMSRRSAGIRRSIDWHHNLAIMMMSATTCRMHVAGCRNACLALSAHILDSGSSWPRFITAVSTSTYVSSLHNDGWSFCLYNPPPYSLPSSRRVLDRHVLSRVDTATFAGRSVICTVPKTPEV